jgi:hypothetical protein
VSGRRVASTVLPLLLAIAWSQVALAYRPFNGTDAAVADPGEVELELGPIQYFELGSVPVLFSPDVVFNYGIGPRWEFVLQGRLAHELLPDSQGPNLVDNGVFLKGVLREGTLQDKPGPSIAAEFGLLLPSTRDEPGTGAGLAVIVSQRWKALTIHLNAGAEMTRRQLVDAACSLIVEGPYSWPVRPVAEFYYEREYGGPEIVSGLVGAIWQVNDKLAVDLALRGGWIDGVAFREVRAGVTIGFGLFDSPARK